MAGVLLAVSYVVVKTLPTIVEASTKGKRCTFWERKGWAVRLHHHGPGPKLVFKASICSDTWLAVITVL